MDDSYSGERKCLEQRQRREKHEPVEGIMGDPGRSWQRAWESGFGVKAEKGGSWSNCKGSWRRRQMLLLSYFTDEKTEAERGHRPKARK